MLYNASSLESAQAIKSLLNNICYFCIAAYARGQILYAYVRCLV